MLLLLLLAEIHHHPSPTWAHILHERRKTLERDTMNENMMVQTVIGLLDDQIKGTSNQNNASNIKVVKSIKVSSFMQTVSAFTKEIAEQHIPREWLTQCIQSVIRDDHKAIYIDFGSGNRTMLGSEMKSKEGCACILSCRLKMGKNPCDAVELSSDDVILDYIRMCKQTNPLFVSPFSGTTYLWLELIVRDIQSEHVFNAMKVSREIGDLSRNGIIGNLNHSTSFTSETDRKSVSKQIISNMHEAEGHEAEKAQNMPCRGEQSLNPSVNETSNYRLNQNVKDHRSEKARNLNGEMLKEITNYYVKRQDQFSKSIDKLRLLIEEKFGRKISLEEANQVKNNVLMFINSNKETKNKGKDAVFHRRKRNNPPGSKPEVDYHKLIFTSNIQTTQEIKSKSNDVFASKSTDFHPAMKRMKKNPISLQ